jgi:hypothetical protein
MQSQGQAIVQQLSDEAADRKDEADSQNQDSQSMEVELVKEGFDQALDLDVPGYVDVLAGLLKKHQ